MNNFTKEELHLIQNAISSALCGPCPIELEHVHEKIQRMIEAYCGHVCDHEFKLCFSFYGQDEKCYRCKKCLIRYEDVISV